MTDHIVCNPLREKVGCFEVRIHHGIIIFLRFLKYISNSCDTGVVDQNIDLAKRVAGGIHQLLVLPKVADIRLHNDCFPAKPFNLLLYGLCRLTILIVVDKHICPLTR